MAASIMLDSPINRDAFHAYVGQVLVPELKPVDVVIMDNFSSRKAPAVRELIEAAGASLLYLPLYSPDINPIGQAIAKLKAHLRKAAERTVYGLWTALGCILNLYSPAECANYFAHSGYECILIENRSSHAIASADGASSNSTTGPTPSTSCGRPGLAGR